MKDTKTKKDSKQLIPPAAYYNLEAEQALLGCVLLDGDIAQKAFADLTEEDFYSPAHRIIFNAIRSILIANMPLDFVILVDQLERTAQLPLIGGLDYVTKVATCVPTAALYSNYLEIVLRESTKRKIAKACSFILGRLKEADDKTILLAEAEKAIYDIGKDSSRGALESIYKSINPFMQQCDDIYKNKASLKGLMTGFKQLDALTNGLHKGELIVLAARPGCGKSSFALNIAEYAAKNGKTVAVFNLEMTRAQLVQRLMCSLASVNMNKAKGSESLQPPDFSRLMMASDVLENCNIYIDDSSLNTPASIMSKCRALKPRDGIDLIIVDYIQLMHADEKIESREQTVATIVRSLKLLAKELEVPVLALSQMNRLFERDKDRPPMLSDLRESGAIEQDADIVLFINKFNNQENSDVFPVELIIAKHRNGELANLPMNWLGRYVHFLDGKKEDVEAAKARASKKSQDKKDEEANTNNSHQEAEKSTNNFSQNEAENDSTATEQSTESDFSDTQHNQTLQRVDTVLSSMDEEDLWKSITDQDAPPEEE